MGPAYMDGHILRGWFSWGLGCSSITWQWRHMAGSRRQVKRLQVVLLRVLLSITSGLMAIDLVSSLVIRTSKDERLAISWALQTTDDRLPSNFSCSSSLSEETQRSLGPLWLWCSPSPMVVVAVSRFSKVWIEKNDGFLFKLDFGIRGFVYSKEEVVCFVLTRVVLKYLRAMVALVSLIALSTLVTLTARDRRRNRIRLHSIHNVMIYTYTP